MSRFDTLYRRASGMLGRVSGETVVYIDADKLETPDTAAIVGKENVIDKPGSQGLYKVRRREVSLRRIAIDRPLLNGSFRVDGEVWPIKEIVSRDANYTRVVGELEGLRDSSRGNYRPRI